MIVLPLRDDDMALVERLSASRNSIKEANGVPTHKVSDWSDQSIHRLGLMAEVAIAAWLGVSIDGNTYYGGDAGYDLCAGGLTVDVKMRSRTGLDLVTFADMSDFRADIAILCWPAGERDVACVGYVSRDRFRLQARRMMIGSNERLVMPWRELAQWR